MKRVHIGGSGEVVEKKSRFIANVFNISSEEEAAVRINEVKKKYWAARHNCFAYVIGDNQELQRFSDDGEPSGTAGKPILDILLGDDLHNCLIVVTRYFGGTLLGTGGLFRAYQAAARAGIAGSELMEVMQGVRAALDTDYNNIGKIQYLCTEMNIAQLGTDYTECVHMELLIHKDIYENFSEKITEKFAGKVRLLKIGPQDYAVVNGKEVILI